MVVEIEEEIVYLVSRMSLVIGTRWSILFIILGDCEGVCRNWDLMYHVFNLIE